MNQPQLENEASTLSLPIIHDGLLIDPDTGEVVGIHGQKPEFRVMDESSADWVLERLMNAELDAAREKSKLKAVQDRLQANIKAAERRSEWLRTRFGPEIEAFAREKLEGAKAKNLKLTFGSLAFRTVKGGLRVADPVLALAWAKQACPDAVKIAETFPISLVPDDVKATILSQNVEGLGFEVKSDTESFSIKTGVGG